MKTSLNIRPAATMLAVVAMVALSACPAAAESCKAPPGMSAIDQYCEAIPSATGERGNTDTDRGGRPYPPATLKSLTRAGSDGQAIVALSAAAQTEAESGKTSPSTRARQQRDASAPAAHAAPAPGNPIAAIAAAFGETGDTTGPLFGTVLLVFALVFFATAWLRYRRRAQG